MGMGNDELMAQYAHIWRVFERLVTDFDDVAWLRTGRKTVTPARLSFHILKATKYYIEDAAVVQFASGKPFDVDSASVPEAELPSREDVRLCIRELAQKTEDWLAQIDLSGANPTFTWAGKTKLGLVIFLLKHTVFHMGELSSLLNESQNGETQDNYVKAL
jgi:hypothetical protein